ncbi:hypothetical protein F511_11625 [Dorcoceras hygrometricum]|uniref:Uncharacterized protein n=1 Tax=Dorcoceras hygrometricum TaxID=472368 RepID=A0A2Z7DDK0_9LAMI|nr:hypothetical protein F511_11625 [Dorcoceras hygrometricum]
MLAAGYCSSCWWNLKSAGMVTHEDLLVLMSPRRRGRGRGQFQEESEGQNEEVQRSVPRRGRDRQVEIEQPVAQQFGHQRFRPRGHQFKKKSGSSSSVSGSSSSGSSKVEFCGKCVGVQGSRWIV